MKTTTVLAVVLALAFALGGCAATNTPAQQRVYDAFDACQRETGVLGFQPSWVGPDGRWRYTYSADDTAGRARMFDCLSAKGMQPRR